MRPEYFLLPWIEFAARITGQDPNRNTWFRETTDKANADAKEATIRLHERLRSGHPQR